MNHHHPSHGGEPDEREQLRSGPRTFGRRSFLGGTLGAGALLAGCGRPDWTPVGAPTSTTLPNNGATSTSVADTSTTLAAGRGIQAATVDEPAVRGEATQATDLPPRRTWRPGQFVMSVDTEERLMALTFDDGPSPHNTESVLRTLDSFGIPASFFLVGVNVQAWPAIARRTAEAGHELANHSVYHSPYQAAALASQIGRNQEIIRDATGFECVAHRAPGLTRGQSILDTCAYYDLYEVHTHMSTYDWLSPRHSAYQLWQEFVRYHRNGAFALYHDGGNRRPTPDALPDIIRSGLDLGYTFVTATELMYRGVPQPDVSTNRYPASDDPVVALGRLTQSESDAIASEQELHGYVDRCNYDAEAELIAALDDPSLTYADRMRIVGVLAEIEAVKQEG